METPCRVCQLSSTNGFSLIRYSPLEFIGACLIGTMIRNVRNNRRTTQHRLCAGVTLFAYLVASLGLPLPAGAAPKDAGQPFPCQDHPCGCRTAEQCWQKCCCFSPEDRFAWAREHNVQPPSYAERPAGNSWHSPRQRDLASKPCCSTHRSTQSERTSCCKNHGQPTCENSSRQEQKPDQKSPAKNKKGKGWVVGVMALQCQGHATTWASAGTVLPPGPPLTWNPWPVLVDQVSLVDELASTLSANPPEPPPRLPLA